MKIPETLPLDIVYLLKPDAYNQDFIYSLRSLVNVKKYRHIVCAGYVPFWMRHCISVHNKQHASKWENVVGNLIAVCNNKKVSEDFVLFNDDFFCVKPTNLYTDLNYKSGTILQKIEKYKQLDKPSIWHKSFFESYQLLKQLKVEHFDNFAVHTPMIFNKLKFLAMLAMPEVIEFRKTHKLFSFRNVYGNLYWHPATDIIDAKPAPDKDLSDEVMGNTWVSVYDDVTSHLDDYPRLKAMLEVFPPHPNEKYIT